MFTSAGLQSGPPSGRLLVIHVCRGPLIYCLHLTSALINWCISTSVLTTCPYHLPSPPALTTCPHRLVHFDLCPHHLAPLIALSSILITWCHFWLLHLSSPPGALDRFDLYPHHLVPILAFTPVLIIWC
ncbi:hypothetical protein DUNSADRAFT_16248 [Dunaliella salina]|uniref:Uncharacterized protein n=1 Tax=Dunaliella salina TaxID=3046 RepID=A0ABQ7H157_DUNSA|nr:hypothetical protein DUNSADRAFT_16248 [Dunaliella salina]|eukprot:KAF5840586.1 hypothetical protein DUNSADRAFT_16248 [Dunaliella salina]